MAKSDSLSVEHHYMQVEKRGSFYQKSFWCDHKLSILIVAFVTINVAVTIATIIVYKNRENNGVESQKLCLPCDNIKSMAERDEESRRIYFSLEKKLNGDTGDEECCAKSSQEAEFVKLILKKLSAKTATGPHAVGLSTLKESMATSIAYAQKALCINKTLENPESIFDNKTCSLELRTNSRLELSKGVEITRQGIKILHPGLYFVYKNINFFPDFSEPCKEYKNRLFKSYLIRQKVDRGPTILLTNEHTCCPNCVHDSETEFSGGVFRLDEGDIIQVNVTGAKVIHVGRDVTYVGLMMMGGQKYLQPHAERIHTTSRTN